MRLRFDAFEIDEADAALLRDGRRIALPPRAFGVLCALARQPGRLVLKDALLDEVWGHRHVSESVLKTTISEVRAALSDDAKRPRYIETVSRRGYRFIGVGEALEAPPPPSSMIGRKANLERLERAASEALGGTRRIVWVAGEPGVGKTTLIDHFVAGHSDFRIARGQCVEQFGTSEPYLPVLEALGSLCREDERMAGMVQSIAPAWMLQLPWLGTPQERAALRAELANSTQERMLREMGELLDHYTQEQPLLLVTEDLHWSDSATVRLIDHIARRRGAARLLWLGSVRLDEAISTDHPLKDLRHELRMHRLCEEVALDPFSEVELAAFVVRTLPGTSVSEDFVRALYRHTDGLPLFAVNVLEEMVAQGALREGEPAPAGDATIASLGVPENLAGVIERQVARLPAESRALLEAASVAGLEFRAAIVAQALESEADPVVARCDELARQGQWLNGPIIGTAPDGSLDPRYAFRHGLYRHVFYQRSGAIARANHHRRVAAALERSRAAGMAVLSSELAMHYERSHDIPSALRHFAVAAQEALRHFAPREALVLSQQALALLPRIPEGMAKLELELALVAPLAIASTHLLGAGSPQARAAFQRAYELGDVLPSAKLRTLELSGMGWVFNARGEFEQARALAARLYEMAAARADPVLQAAACGLLGTGCLHLGDLTASRKFFEQAHELYVQLGQNAEVFISIAEPGVMLNARLAQVLSHLGFPDRGRKLLADAELRAKEVKQPFANLMFQLLAGTFEVRLERVESARALADTVRVTSAENAFAHGEGWSDWLNGWVLWHSGEPAAGAARIMRGFERLSHLGMLWGSSGVLGHAAAAHCAAGNFAEAQERLDDAFAMAERTGERLFIPDLNLVKGRIAEGMGNVAGAREAICAALGEARAQQALWLELLALTALCELKGAAAADRANLQEAYGRLTEGFDTPLAGKIRAILPA